MNPRGLGKILNLLTPRWRKRLGWTVAIVVGYTIIGFIFLPLIARMVAVKHLGALFGRDVAIQTVRINPYALSASIRGLLIKDKDGEVLASWDEAYANFQLVSFFGKPWVFREVRLVNPYARVQVNKDYSLNFSDL